MGTASFHFLFFFFSLLHFPIPFLYYCILFHQSISFFQLPTLPPFFSVLMSSVFHFSASFSYFSTAHFFCCSIFSPFMPLRDCWVWLWEPNLCDLFKSSLSSWIIHEVIGRSQSTLLSNVSIMNNRLYAHMAYLHTCGSLYFTNGCSAVSSLWWMYVC